MDRSIDRILTDLKAEYEALDSATESADSEPASQPHGYSVPSYPPAKLPSQPIQALPESGSKSRSKPSAKPSDQTGDMQFILQELRDSYAAEDQALAIASRQQWTAEAQTWLEHLDLNSFDAYWFEVFAKPYPSRLEAAIAYLQGMDQLEQQS